MQADYVLNYDVLSVAKERHLYLLARIKARPASGDSKRRPLNLSVVFDRSGSMAGEKIENVKKAIQFLVQHLSSDDRFSLVIYDDEIEVKIPPGPVIHKDNINQIIRQVNSRGATNLSGGWLQGCQLVTESSAEGQVNRVLLLTDGLANQGITDLNRLAGMARQKNAEGVTTTTMGVGMDFNEDLLTLMAAEGGGAFYFIDNPDQAPIIFSEELEHLLSVVGQNLTITLTLSPDVEMVRQLNDYPMDKDLSAATRVFRMGDLYADEIKTLLLEMFVPALDTLGEFEIAQLRFDYDELDEEIVTHRTIDIPIVVNTVPQEEASGLEQNTEVTRTALLLSAARARADALKYADTGNFKEATDSLRTAADAIEDSGLTDDEDLQTEHDMLREESVDMEMGPQRYDAYMRKASTTKSFTTSHGVSDTRTMHELHQRHKTSRDALERNGPTPEVLVWKGNSYDLSSANKIRIGRGSNNEIALREKGVSNDHCQIVRDGDSLYLEDLNSTNGTFANGGIVEGRFRLSVDDVMTIGPLLFRYQAGE